MRISQISKCPVTTVIQIGGVPFENVNSYGDVTITREGLQILTYTRHSRPLSSQGFISEVRPITEHLALGAITIRFYDLGMSQPGFVHPIFRMRGERSKRLHYQNGMKHRSVQQ